MGILKNSYRLVYRHSPPVLRGLLSRTMLSLPGKPSVKPCAIPSSERFPDGNLGAFIISADFEMAWAWRYAISGENPEKMGLRERENVVPLLELFRRYKVPITWATVGHLFLDSCKKNNNVAHPNLRRIPYFTNRIWTYEKGDWYDQDPCSDLSHAKAWYAPDLIEKIIEADANHEIGCHTFSHLECTDRHCPPQVMEDEIVACRAVAERLGIHLKSMVFPGGTNGNYQVLKDQGFTNYRINAEWDLFYPEKDVFGLWRLPSSASVMDHGFGWSAQFYEHMYRKYIDKAIATGTVCHLWFHPCLDDFSLHEVFPKILAYADQCRQSGKLWIGTMGDMAAFCEERHGSGK